MESVFIKEECMSSSSDEEPEDSIDQRIREDFKRDGPAATAVEVIIEESSDKLNGQEDLIGEQFERGMTGNSIIENLNRSQSPTQLIMGSGPVGLMDNYPCPDCEASFISFFYLEAHRKMCKSRLHLREKKDSGITSEENIQRTKVEVDDSAMYEKRNKEYLCKVCSYTTKKCSSMKGHMRTHTGDRPFCCPFCSYAAAESGQVKRHMRIHSGERPYACPQCDYSAAVITNLKNHLLTHSQARPFRCQRCPFSSTQSTSLKEHMRTHTGEKPFRCSYCEYCCSRSNTLKRHLMTHTGRKPFQCTVCEYRCAETGALKVHMRTHTGERPFACTLCAYRCIQSGELRRHVRSKHKRDPDEVLHNLAPAPTSPCDNQPSSPSSPSPSPTPALCEVLHSLEPPLTSLSPSPCEALHTLAPLTSPPATSL